MQYLLHVQHYFSLAILKVSKTKFSILYNVKNTVISERILCDSGLIVRTVGSSHITFSPHTRRSSSLLTRCTDMERDSGTSHPAKQHGFRLANFLLGLGTSCGYQLLTYKTLYNNQQDQFISKLNVLNKRFHNVRY